MNKLTDLYDTCFILTKFLFPLDEHYHFNEGFFYDETQNKSTAKYYIHNWVSGFSDFKRKKEDERENHKPIFKLCSVYPFVATVSLRYKFFV